MLNNLFVHEIQQSAIVLPQQRLKKAFKKQATFTLPLRRPPLASFQRSPTSSQASRHGNESPGRPEVASLFLKIDFLKLRYPIPYPKPHYKTPSLSITALAVAEYRRFAFH